MSIGAAGFQAGKVWRGGCRWPGSVSELFLQRWNTRIVNVQSSLWCVMQLDSVQCLCSRCWSSCAPGRLICRVHNALPRVVRLIVTHLQQLKCSFECNDLVYVGPWCVLAATTALGALLLVIIVNPCNNRCRHAATDNQDIVNKRTVDSADAAGLFGK